MKSKNRYSLQANLFKTLSHYKRVQIIQLLRKSELSVSEIHKKLGYSQSNISQHLMLLRGNNIVEARKDGKRVFYKIRTKKLIKLCDLINKILDSDEKISNTNN